MAIGADDLIGMGVVISLQDAFSRTAQAVIGKLEALALKAKGSSAAVTSSLREMKAGFALFAAGGAVLFGLNHATDHAMAFSSAIARVRTVADESSMSVAGLRKSAMDLNSAYGGGAAKQADAMYYALSTGITDATKATELLSQANKFAIGGVTDVTTATRGLAYVTAAYAGQNVSAAHAADLLFKTSAAGLSTPEELAQSIGLVASVAAQTGVSLEELSGVIGRATQTMTNESAITGFRQALANIANGDHMKQTREEAKRLGIEFNSAHLRAVGFEQFLHEMITAPGFTQQSLEKLFHSVEARSVVMALAAEGGAKFTAVMKDMKNAAGAADEAFRKVSGTSEFQGKLLAAGLDNASITIGASLEPVKARIVGVLASMVQGFNSLPEPVVTFVTRLVAAAAAASTLAGIFLMIHGATILWGAAAAYVTPIFAAAWAALLPVLPLLAGLAAAAGLLYLAWDENFAGVRDVLMTWWEDASMLVEGVVALFGSSKDGVGQIPATLHDALVRRGLWAVAKDIFVWGERISDFISGVWQGMKAGFTVVAAVVGIVGRVLLWVVGLVGVMAGAVGLGTEALFGYAAGTDAASIAVDGIGKVLGFGIGILVAWRGVVMLARVAQAAWAVVLGVVTAAQWAWNLAMTANPLGLIIAGVGALILVVAALVRYWDCVALAAATAWQFMQQAVGADTTSIEATIAGLRTKIQASEAGVVPGAGVPTSADRESAGFAWGPLGGQAAAAPAPSGGKGALKNVIHLKVDLDGKNVHQSVVERENEVQDMTFGVVD